MENVDKKMRISAFYFPIYNLGPSKRFVLWTQGCDIRCEGCISQHTWDKMGGIEVSVEELIKKMIVSKKSGCEGITISGGEPFLQYGSLLILLKEIKREYDDILVYTGYRFENIKNEFKSCLRYISVLIDGKYIKDKKSNLIWRGSNNQKMIILSKKNVIREKYEKYRRKRKNNIFQRFKFENEFIISGIPK
ncbi:MAG: 4Fe-4S single cluster domain-containing protein [candidate division WOR-3 bacterium]